MTLAKVYVAGHRGMVGAAIVRRLQAAGYEHIICKTHAELDLTDQSAVNAFFMAEKPDHVYLAAAKVGGIHANSTYPADFIYQNIMIQSNVIHAAYVSNVSRLLFLGSSCIYPRDVAQPMREEALLTSVLEPTNEPYAIAKIAGIKMCESYNRQFGCDYRSVMPTNLYGPGDNYHPENSHVIPGLIRRFHEAKIKNDPTVMVWGSGRPKREFLYVDDMAEACVHIAEIDRETYDKSTLPTATHINVGCGYDMSIKALAHNIAEIVGYQGNISFDKSKPDGTPRKLMDSSRLKALGWEPRISFEDGIRLAYRNFIETH